MTFELVAATYALVSPYVLHWLASWVPATIGPAIGDAGLSGLLASLLVSTVALLPATICMGATLPALVEARRRARTGDPDGRGLGRLYGANTFGAVFGTLLAVHLILPALGLAIGALVLAAFGYAAAALGYTWSRQHGDAAPPAASEARAIDTSGDPDPELVRERWLLYVLVFGTGLAGVGGGGDRRSRAVPGDEQHGLHLRGRARGVPARHRRRRLAVPAPRGAERSRDRQRGWPLACCSRRPSRSCSPPAFFAPSPICSPPSPDPSLGFRALLLAEAIAAAAVFIVPTMLMGALFSHLLGLLAGRGIGRAYALNTLGSALAPFVLGLVALPRLGLTDAMFSLAWGYLALLVLFAWFRRFSTTWQVASMGLVLAATVLGRGSLVLVEPPEGWTVLERHEGVMGLVTVSEQKDATDTPLRRLQVDRQFRMGGALSIGERRMGHIPLLLHGNARHALFLGVGTGATAGASLDHAVESVDAIELVPEVIEVLPHFHEINGRLDESERVTLHTADARRWLAGSDQTWDVIVADLFHPERDGAGFLYSREHFDAVRSHLSEGGLFVQWLPLHQLDENTLRTIVATFLDVYPEAHSWLALYNVESPAFALIGRDSPEPLVVDLDHMVETIRAPAFAPVVLQDPRDTFAAYMLDRDALAQLAADAPINTDLRPVVLFEAPKSGRDGLGARNLELLLPMRTGYPEGLATARDMTGFRAITTAFSTALEHYLRAEMILVRESRPGEPMPETAVEHYVAAYEAAPDFVPPGGRLRAQIASLNQAGFEEEARALVERLEAAEAR